MPSSAIVATLLVGENQRKTPTGCYPRLVSRAASLERALRRAVRVRRALPAMADPLERRRLELLLHDLLREIGFTVPKTRAAALLGVSVNALERWIAAGRLPTVRRPGSSRAEVDADALLDVAVEVDRLREDGLRRGVLAAAFERLAAEGKPRRRLRPNMPAQLLREDFVRLTPLERLETGAELSYAGAILASRGRRRREQASPNPRPLQCFELVRVLRRHAVEFVVIGGFAVILHGYERYTKDLNIVPEPRDENLARLKRALTELEAQPTDVGYETRLGRLSVMNTMSGIESYEELLANAMEVVVPDAGSILFAALDDVLTMKRAAGRDMDLIDITALRMAHGLEE
jgi:hypothetical protein